MKKKLLSLGLVLVGLVGFFSIRVSGQEEDSSAPRPYTLEEMHQIFETDSLILAVEALKLAENVGYVKCMDDYEIEVSSGVTIREHMKRLQ